MAAYHLVSETLEACGPYLINLWDRLWWVTKSKVRFSTVMTAVILIILMSNVTLSVTVGDEVENNESKVAFNKMAEQSQRLMKRHKLRAYHYQGSSKSRFSEMKEHSSKWGGTTVDLVTCHDLACNSILVEDYTITVLVIVLLTNIVTITILTIAYSLNE